MLIKIAVLFPRLAGSEHCLRGGDGHDGLPGHSPAGDTGRPPARGPEAHAARAHTQGHGGAVRAGKGGLVTLNNKGIFASSS